jgi:hypothetical protein
MAMYSVIGSLLDSVLRWLVVDRIVPYRMLVRKDRISLLGHITTPLRYRRVEAGQA